MTPYEKKAEKLVNKISVKLNIDIDSAKMLAAKYLNDTLNAITESTLNKTDKKKLIKEQLNILVAIK